MLSRYHRDCDGIVSLKFCSINSRGRMINPVARRRSLIKNGNFVVIEIAYEESF